MSYRPQSELGVLAHGLLADLERLRPGWPAETPMEELQRMTQNRANLRLTELYRDQHGGDAESQDAAQLSLYRREINQILLPRYVALAHRQNHLEKERCAGGGYNRLAYTVLFMIVGVFAACATSLSIWAKWVPFLLALMAPWLSPFLPDLYRKYIVRPYELGLRSLVRDLDQAGLALPVIADPLCLPAPAR